MGQAKQYDREYKEEALKLVEEKGCKKASEELGILAQLGITPSSAIQMLYSQVVLRRGMPFDLQLPVPTAIGTMTREELDAELLKGVNSLKNGEGYTADEVDSILAEEFGI